MGNNGQQWAARGAAMGQRMCHSSCCLPAAPCLPAAAQQQWHSSSSSGTASTPHLPPPAPTCPPARLPDPLSRCARRRSAPTSESAGTAAPRALAPPPSCCWETLAPAAAASVPSIPARRRRRLTRWSLSTQHRWAAVGGWMGGWVSVRMCDRCSSVLHVIGGRGLQVRGRDVSLAAGKLKAS